MQATANSVKKLTSATSLDDYSTVLAAWPQWKCCINGSRVIQTNSKKFLFFQKVDVVYHVRVATATHRWIVHHTIADFRQLHEALLAVAANNAAFTDALVHFPLPREHLFGRRDMLVIKGMCGNLEHYLVNLLRYIQRTASDSDSARMADLLRVFLSPPTCLADPVDTAPMARAKII
ncbi:hypothetical protein SPRG_13004 [Saprolegnia parasitica CBS 223.65]|uniref:PX domain-containing protein n=1 Tax=Saprolegnia parasitica (strain CBS 223.65) TaxID=695850 RepID=A0A067C573_SAPPC|nr:hypothetical protein SPRG_13004 [Saprolegnia parasitica CBS 223.65]KDO21666.1 hypothetical protein SPRG_13004 [Saprolegnia parasitica CBS 223.65]|eukprot:XP_012207590.1 hypothetical protein SPRG_13004 [Saprolegnia parasitica CBS 223.65]